MLARGHGSRKDKGSACADASEKMRPSSRGVTRFRQARVSDGNALLNKEGVAIDEVPGVGGLSVGVNMARRGFVTPPGARRVIDKRTTEKAVRRRLLGTLTRSECPLPLFQNAHDGKKRKRKKTVVSEKFALGARRRKAQRPLSANEGSG